MNRAEKQDIPLSALSMNTWDNCRGIAIMAKPKEQEPLPLLPSAIKQHAKIQDAILKAHREGELLPEGYKIGPFLSPRNVTLPHTIKEIEERFVKELHEENKRIISGGKCEIAAKKQDDEDSLKGNTIRSPDIEKEQAEFWESIKELWEEMTIYNKVQEGERKTPGEFSPSIEPHKVDIMMSSYSKGENLSASGEKGGKISTKLPGIVLAVEQYRADHPSLSFEKFWQEISKSQYIGNNYYRIDGFALYVKGERLFCRDETKKNKKGKINSQWKSRAKSTVDDIFYGRKKKGLKIAP